MKKYLPNNYTKYQKFLAVIILVPAAFTWVQILLPKNFLPLPWVDAAATYLAIGLTSLVYVLVIYWKRSGKVESSPEWYWTGRVKKILVIAFGPLLLFWIYHTVFAFSVPRAWSLTGHESGTVTYTVIKELGGGRHSCDYQLVNDLLHYMFFELRISHTTHSQKK